MKIVLVRGAQADDARRHLGLLKVTRATAEALWNVGFPVILTGNNVNSHHFFTGWNLAYPMRPKSEDGNFSVAANAFVANLEPELGTGPAFFLRPELSEDELRTVGLATYLLFEAAVAAALSPKR